MPDSTVLQFSDPYEYQASVRASDVKVLVTTSGDFQAKLARMDLHRLWMQRGRASLPLVAHTAVKKGRSPIFFLADAHQSSMHHSGMEVCPGDIVFTSSGAEHYHRASTASHWASMSLTPEELAAAGRALTGYDLAAPAATRLIRPPPHLMSRLLHLHETVGRLAATLPDMVAHPEVSRAIEQELVRVMVGCLTDGVAVGPDSLRRKRMPVMRLFERFLEENPGRPLYVTEVCAAIGVVDRTLRLHCLEHLGMSPNRYLWLRRMHQARRALALADPTAMTVTAIANDHGFGELGRFAVTYGKLFGEPPSATLRRASDYRPVVQDSRSERLISVFA